MTTVNDYVVGICSSLVRNSRQNHIGNSQALSAETDWEELIFQLEKHNLLLQSWKYLRDYQQLISQPSLYSSLKQKVLATSMRNLSHTAELISVLNNFSKNQIDALPFKGPLLAVEAYGELYQRAFTDLDILIRRSDIPAVRVLLKEQGYVELLNCPDCEFDLYMEFENFIPFYNKEKCISIDLHWELTGRYGQVPMHYEDISSIRTIELSGHQIPILPYEEELLYLCIHSSSHCWDKLEHIVAFAKLLTLKEPDWQRVLVLAKRYNCLSMLRVGISLTKEVCKIESLDRLDKSLKSSARIRWATQRIIKAYLKEPGAGDGLVSWRFDPIHLVLRDSLWDSITYFFRLFFVPTYREFNIYKTTKPSPRAWYLMRPLGLGAACLSLACRKLKGMK